MDLPVAPDLPLRTERLVLRAFRPQDVDAVLGWQADPEAVRYVPYGPRDRDQVVEALERETGSTGLREEGDLLELAVERADDGTLIGDVLLVLRSVEHETLEIGYLFATAQQGRGYATESVRALVDLAFSALGARRLVARVDARNTPSRALLERLGFRQEAYLVENEWFKGELSSELDYAVLSREWPPANRGEGAARPG